MKKKKAKETKPKTGSGFKRPAETENLLSGASTLMREERNIDEGEAQEALQRDIEPDDFDSGTNTADDRVRGAGGQSLAELVIAQEKGWGLDEHGGGLRHDRPEPNVNDYDPDETIELNEEDKNKIA